MAEIRINATGGVKLYDADDSHYAQIVAGTITSNVDAITLGHDTVTIADNLSLGSDSAVLKFGADGDTTLTHTDGTGLTLNSTNKICFNDASQFIQGSSNAVLSLGATDEIDLTATAVDLNGTLNVSGVATFQSNPVFPDGGVAIADLDIDGGTDIGAAIVDADLFIIDDGAGGTNRKTTASRIKTYIGGGLTEADHWKIGSDVDMTASSETTLTSWSRVTANGSAGNSLLGTGLSHSSGVFSFPSTGYWWIRLETDAFADAAEAVSQYLIINTTLDNSSYGQAKWAFFGQASGYYQTFATEFLFDVTNITNDKFKITYYTTQTNNLRGGTDLLAFRLADT